MANCDFDFGVRTRTVEENMLFTLPQFTEEVWNTDASVKKAGVFKVNLGASCQGSGSSLQDLIEVGLSQGLESCAVKQHLLGFSEQPFLYGYRSFAPGDEDSKDDGVELDVRDVHKDRADISHFLQSAQSVASYSAETCCSKALQKNPTALIDHYFRDIVPAMCVKTRSQAVTVQRLLKQGTRDRERTDKFLSGLKRLPVPEREKYIKDCLAKDTRKELEDCACSGCLGDSGLNFKKAGSAVYGQAIGISFTDGVRMTKHFGLYAVACCSILKMLPHKFPGITSPMLYFGSEHSLFPAHVEDFLLFSINYLHYGHPKVWFVVPSAYTAVVHELIARTSVSTSNCSCSNLLSHKYFMLSPQWLIHNKIPFKVVIQNPGEAVIVGPNVIHFGFNCGHNCAESTNFATKDWVPYGMASTKCSCLGSQAHLDIARIVAMTEPLLLDGFLKQNHATPPGVVGPGGSAGNKGHSHLLTQSSACPSAADNEEAGTTVASKRPRSAGSDDSTLPSKAGPSSAVNQDEDNDSSDSSSNDSGADDDVDAGAGGDILYPSPPRKAAKHSFAQCPKPGCMKEFRQPRKKKMIDHVRSKHEGDVCIIEMVEKMFPSTSQAKEEKVPCPDCNLPVARGRFQSVMRRHQDSTGCKPKPS